MYIVVNHLHLRDSVTDVTVQAAHDATQKVVDAGALAARVVKVDETHLVLMLDFASPADADRVSRGVEGPWMSQHIVLLLANGTDRHVGEVIASSRA